MMKRLICLLMPLLLAGCAHQGAIAPGAVSIAPDVELVLPQDIGMPIPVEASQLVIGTYKDQKFVFETRISGDKDHFEVVGFDMTGRRSVSMNWTKDGITYETAPGMPPQLSPEYILADMLLIYAAPEKARAALNNTGALNVTEKHRTLLKDGDKIIAIDYQAGKNADVWSQRVHYENLARGYTLDIQSSRVTP